MCTSISATMTDHWTMLCRLLQVCVLVQNACCIVEQEIELEVTELTSSVNASRRNFACHNEEVVYRCVTRSTMYPFEIIWTWNGTEQVGRFHSNDTIGENNTCNSDDKLSFLHSTLVFANNSTRVSLLIVTPSLPNYTNLSVPIECEAIATAAGKLNTTNLMINHTTISGIPQWNNNAEDNITLSCDSYSTMSDTSTRFLLNISWPGITNDETMDFNYYTLNLRIAGENNMSIYNFHGETTARWYKNLMFHVEAVSNMGVHISIDAVNKCNYMNTLRMNRSLSRDNCTNYILNCSNPIPATTETNSGSDSSSKYAIILITSLGGLITFIVFGRLYYR